MRRFLEEQEFFIEREIMIKEDGKYYFVLGVSKGTGNAMDYGREVFYRYGRLLLEERDPVLLEYLKKEEGQLEAILGGLSRSKTEAAEKRMEELRQEMAWNKEAQDEMR